MVRPFQRESSDHAGLLGYTVQYTTRSRLLLSINVGYQCLQAVINHQSQAPGVDAFMPCGRLHGAWFWRYLAGVELELNLIPLVRLGVGASYRYTSDITLPGTPSDALRGINAGVTIKVGKF